MIYLQTFSPNGKAKPKNNQITVKKENDFFVKQEPTDGQMFICENVDVRLDDVSSKQIHQLKLKDMEKQIVKLKMELEAAKKKHQHECTELINKNKSLSRANKAMVAHIKQLQTGIDSGREANKKKLGNKKVVLGERNCDTSSNSSNEAVYEVAKIISHKTDRGKELFLIRWKGFDSSHDTWERKKNFNCPKKLREYFSSLNKNIS